MPVQIDVNEDRKNQILDAAMTVFNRLGFHKAKVDDIAEEAKLSKGGIYWHFPSKDAILVGIFERMLANKRTALLSIQDRQDTSGNRLLQVPNLVVMDLKQIRKWMPLVFEYVAIGLRDEAIQQMVRLYAEMVKESLKPIVQQGVDSGEFRPIDPEKATIAIMSIMEGIVLLEAFGSPSLDLEKEVIQGVQFLLEGIQVPDGA